MHATRHKEREKSGVEQLTELYILYQQKAWNPLMEQNLHNAGAFEALLNYNECYDNNENC